MMRDGDEEGRRIRSADRRRRCDRYRRGARCRYPWPLGGAGGEGRLGAGTSSKSTKLIHAAYATCKRRYLSWTTISTRWYAKRYTTQDLPSHRALPQRTPAHHVAGVPWWQIPYYICRYQDVLHAGRSRTWNPPTSWDAARLSRRSHAQVERPDGAVLYYDGQHNDTRMNVALALTAVTMVPLWPTIRPWWRCTRNGPRRPDQVCGARLKDELTGEEWNVRCKGVINATGPFSDALRKMDEPPRQEIVAPSSACTSPCPVIFAAQHGPDRSADLRWTCDLLPALAG